MKKWGVGLVSALCLVALVRCQQADTASAGGQTIGMVQDAGGTNYDLSCLRNNADIIKAAGRAAMGACAVDPQSMSSTQANRLFARQDAYLSGYYYYPPYYWSPSYASSYNTSNTTTGYEYNYLCSFIFGTQWDASCYYDLLLFSATSYNSYNSNCSQCLSYSPVTQSYCFNSCSMSWSVPYY